MTSAPSVTISLGTHPDQAPYAQGCIRSDSLTKLLSLLDHILGVARRNCIYETRLHSFLRCEAMPFEANFALNSGIVNLVLNNPRN